MCGECSPSGARPVVNIDRMVLTDRQQALLQRIADGDDLSGPEAVGERTSARALASRRLVKVSTKNGRWSAKITADGKHFLLHGRRPGQGIQAPSTSAAKKAAIAKTTKPVTTAAAALDKARELIAQLEAAPDRVVWVSTPDPETRAAYRRAVHAAKQHKLVPEGFSLQHSGRDHGDIAMRLSDDVNPDETEWNRIRAKVRNEITGLDEILQKVAEGGSVVGVTDEDLRVAAVDVVQVFIETARAAGHHVVLSRLKLKFTVEGGETREVYVRQEYNKVAHVATLEEQRKARREWAFKVPEFDSVPARRFELFMNYGHNKRDRWEGIPVAGHTGRIRKIIGDVVESTRVAREAREVWRKEYEAEQERHRRKKQEEEDLWNKAMTHARRQAVLHIRAETFQSAFDAWRRAHEIRDFCAALELGSSNDSDLGDLTRWIEWGLATADDIDPTIAPKTLAATSFDIEPGPDDLRPHLGQWSPDGPYREYRNSREPQSEPRDNSYRNQWHHGMRGKPNWWRR